MTARRTEGRQKRVLVLCVDRDGDLKTKTPLIGRMENLNAAVALALRDPEEPDANAMFEAVRIYDHLQGEGKSDEILQVATISGSELGDVSADRKIVTELNDLLRSFPADEVILVTDGYSDEAVLPLIESRVPVLSVRRVVVRHSKSIEETAALFTRYFKMILENPRYSRIALGLPGLLLLTLGIFSILGLAHYYAMFFIIFLSICMLIKGFRMDKAIKNFYAWMKEYSPPPLPAQISNFSALAGALCIGIGAYLGWNVIAENVAVTNIDWFTALPQVTGYFIKGSMDLLVSGVCVVLSGRAICWYLERDIKLLRNIALIVLVVWGRRILDVTSSLLINPKIGYEILVFSIIIGILIGVASLAVIVVIHKFTRDFFRKVEEHVGGFKEG